MGLDGPLVLLGGVSLYSSCHMVLGIGFIVDCHEPVSHDFCHDGGAGDEEALPIALDHRFRFGSIDLRGKSPSTTRRLGRRPICFTALSIESRLAWWILSFSISPGVARPTLDLVGLFEDPSRRSSLFAFP